MMIYIYIICNANMGTGKNPGRSGANGAHGLRKVQGKKSETDETETLTARESLPKNEGGEPQAWKFLSNRTKK
jgi:hypothetical protein